jgi:S-adenosylmethionine:tRNA ribosyltransferase-isomerase
VREAVERYGRMPLPPYIERAAEPADASATRPCMPAPKARLPRPRPASTLRPRCWMRCGARRRVATVVLHVGVGTFRPVEVEDPAEHVMHAEWYEVTEAQAADERGAAAAAGCGPWARR